MLGSSWFFVHARLSRTPSPHVYQPPFPPSLLTPLDLGSPTSPAPNHPPTALAATREWERMTVGGREPRYSDNFKKRLDLPTGAVPATPPAAGNGVKEYGVVSL